MKAVAIDAPQPIHQRRDKYSVGKIGQLVGCGTEPHAIDNRGASTIAIDTQSVVRSRSYNYVGGSFSRADELTQCRGFSSHQLVEVCLPCMSKLWDPLVNGAHININR